MESDKAKVRGCRGEQIISGKEEPIEVPKYDQFCEALDYNGVYPTGRQLRSWAVRGRWNISRTRKVHLEMVWLPGGYYTSREAFERFCRELGT